MSNDINPPPTPTLQSLGEDIASEAEKVSSEVKTEVESVTSKIARFEKHFKKSLDQVMFDLIEHVFGKVP